MEKGLQYKRTDRAIVNAFIKLVNQGSFEKLTVQEILDEALVSRNTFYSHYRDKYDIAEQIFEQYKKDFLELLKESYTNVGKEWAGTDKFSQFSDLPTQTFLRFHQEHGEVTAALNKIKTDTVDMDQFVSQLFKERYLHAPSNQTHLSSERDLNLEAEIYASVFHVISRHYTYRSQTDAIHASMDATHINESLCHAFLYSMGIIEESHQTAAFQYIMTAEKEAKKLKENYQ